MLSVVITASRLHRPGCSFCFKQGALRHPYTQELLKAFPDLSQPNKRLVSIPGYPPKLDVLPTDCRFAPRCPLAFERCTLEIPLLHSLNGSDHIVSCHLVDTGLKPPSSEAGRPAILEGETSNPIDLPSGCRFHPRCPLAMAVCKQTDPHLIPVSESHQAACLLLVK